MGKHKNQALKRKKRRPRPTVGLMTEEEAEMEAEIENQPEETSTCYPIVNQLSSQDVEDREYACASISHLCQESEEVLKNMLEQGAVKKLLQNLVDPISLSLRIGAAGALRNLSIVGGFEACEHMVEKDCMTLLLSSLQQNYEKVTSEMSEGEGQEEKKLQNHLMTQIIALLCNLCESSERATSAITKTNSILGALYFLRTDLFPQELAIATAQLINIVTDENPPVVKQITSSTVHMTQLRDLFLNTNTNPHLRALLAGILYNTTTKKTHAEILKLIFPFLSSSVEYDGLAEDFLKLEPHFAAMVLDQKEEEVIMSQTKKPYEDELSNWRNAMKAQQFSLELLTNICSSDETELEVNVPPEVVQLVTESGLAAKVLKRCAFIPNERRQQIQHFNFKDFLDQFDITQQRAIAALGNIVLAIPSQAMANDVTTLWNFLCQICVEATPLDAFDILESTTGVMSCLIKKFPTFEPLPAHIQGIFQFGRGSPSPDIRSNCISILGVLGQQSNASLPPLELATALLDNLVNSSPLVVAESLNAIFDVFAEAPSNEVVKQTDMLQKLVKCLQLLRGWLSSHQTQPFLTEDILERVEEAEVNLTRFLEYKYEQFR